MRSADTDRKRLDIQEIRSLIPSIPIGVKLHLRQGVLPAAKLREFRFKGQGEKGGVKLAPETATYIWEANVEYIDWERYLEENPESAK